MERHKQLFWREQQSQLTRSLHSIGALATSLDLLQKPMNTASRAVSNCRLSGRTVAGRSYKTAP